MVSPGKKEMDNLLNSYLIWISRRVLGQGNRSLAWITTTENCGSSVNSQTWARLQTLRTPWMKGARSPWGRTLQHRRNFILLLFLPAFPKGTYSFLPGWLCTGEKEIIRLQEVLNAGSKLTRILGDPKHECGPPVRVQTYGGQVINGVLAQVYLTVSLVGPRTHPVVILKFRIHHWNRHTQKLAESPCWFPKLWVEDDYCVKGQIEVTRTAPLGKQ